MKVLIVFLCAALAVFAMPGVARTVPTTAALASTTMQLASAGRHTSGSANSASGSSKSATPAAISAKDKFDLGYQSLSETFDMYTKNVMATATLILAAIGWLVTSTDARRQIAGNKMLRDVVLLSMMLIGAIHLLVSQGLATISEKKFLLLDTMRYVDRGFYEDYRISTGLLIANGIFVLALFAILSVLVVKSKAAESAVVPPYQI